MSDFVVLPENHTFVMDAPEVATETVAFLRTGQFDREGPQAQGTRVGGLAGIWFGP
jgi:hypothetical protein